MPHIPIHGGCCRFSSVHNDIADQLRFGRAASPATPDVPQRRRHMRAKRFSSAHRRLVRRAFALASCGLTYLDIAALPAKPAAPAKNSGQSA